MVDFISQFGHGLHGMLANTVLSWFIWNFCFIGTVELPSQMETGYEPRSVGFVHKTVSNRRIPGDM
jgi:hypothetical protein